MADERGGEGRRLSRGRLVFYILILVCAPFIMYLGLVRDLRFFLVPSESMEPTLLRGDYLVTLNDQPYHRGDIIVLRDPTQAGAYLVKRIAGLPGDTVAVVQGALILNGKYASEPYIKEPIQYEMEPVTVPEGQVFVLGDNRNNSEDSSMWTRERFGIDHTVSQDAIVGRVRYIYFPFSRMGPVAGYPLTNSEGQ